METEILSLRSFVDDGGAGLRRLVFQLLTQDRKTFRFSKVYPGEIAVELLEAVGFSAAGAHQLYAATAQSV